MVLSIIAEQPPLGPDHEGVIRVGGSRVTLDTVVEAFNEGLAAEEIVQQYPTLSLAHVYGAITYYLNHKLSVDEYIAQRQTEAKTIRQQNEARFDMSGLRARLLARRPGRE
jgi:uncharacterized protein (DUF433 family)